MKIEDIKKNIEQCKLSIKDVDKLLLEVSWIEHPDLIRELLAYKSEPTKAAATFKTEEEIKNEWKTEKLSDGTLKLVSYKGTDEVVEILEMIGKAKVSELGDFVLAMNQPRIKKEMKEARARIKSVIIGDFIKKIGASAFEGCEGLEQVSLSQGITELPEKCFSGCKKLKKVILPETMTKISECAFEDCENLVDINIPKELVSIEDWAFRNCRKLADLTIPETVTKIPENQGWGGPFSGCKKLTLHVKADSFAEKYAKKNEINYVEE